MTAALAAEGFPDFVHYPGFGQHSTAQPPPTYFKSSMGALSKVYRLSSVSKPLADTSKVTARVLF